MGTGRADLGTRTLPKATTPEEENQGEAARLSTIPGARARDTTSQGCHKGTQIHKHRRNFKAFGLLASKRAGNSRNKHGYASSKAGSTSAGRRSTAVFSSQLGAGLQRPMDPGDNTRVQAGVHRQALSEERAATSTPRQTESPSTRRGAREDGNQMCNRTSDGYLGRMLCQPDVCGSQVGRLMEASNKSEESEPAHSDKTLQDGVHQDSQGPPTGEGSHGETGPQGCLPINPFTPTSQEVRSFPLERPVVEIQVPPLRTEQRSLHIHKAHETSSCSPEETGCQNDPVPRRHAYHGNDREGSGEMPSISPGAFDSLGLCDQHKEKHNAPGPGVGVSGFCAGFKEHENFPTTWENQSHSEGSRQPHPSTDWHCEAASTVAGNDGGCTPSNLASTTTLQTPGETENTGPEERPVIRDPAGSNTQHGGGLELVDRGSSRTQRKTHPDNTLGSHYRDRCIQDGMGGLLPGRENRRFVDPTGETETHQFSGAVGSLPSTEKLPIQQEKAECAPEDRQCDHNCLSQPDGGYPFPRALRSSSGSLEVVPGERNCHPRRTPARQGEHQGRLGVTTRQGLQRLVAPEGHFPPTGDQTGTIFHRFVCITNKHTAPCVLQLAPRPRSADSGCLVPTMGESSCLHVPSICLDHSLPGEASIRASKCSASGPSLAQPDLVPFSPQVPDGFPDPTNAGAEHTDRSRGSESPTGASGPSTSGRLAHLRRSFLSAGLSDGVIELIRKSWRSSTESAYSSAWHQWDSWCLRRGIDPLSAPLKDILEFLMLQFQTGKQYRTINTLRSAISMTHIEVDGVRVGQHPLVSRLLKGVFNSRPPAPRYSSTWDVSCVLSYLENSSDNKSLTLQALTHKVAMLMALSNADRCSDLAALDLNHRTYQTNGVRFIIPGLTKSRRNGPPIEAFYPSFQGSPKLCPVRALREYEERSQELREGGTTNPLFVSVRKPHAPVKPCTIGKWLKRVMANAGIDTSVFSAHSTRGAATSKARVAGVSTTDILKAANWTSESTFCRFYHRPVLSPEFGLGVLRK